MRKIVAIVFATAAAVAIADVLPKRTSDFMKNRRIAVKRDTTTLPGYVITTWYRNGRPDTKAQAVVTNKLTAIVGQEQHNALQNELEVAELDAKKARKVEKAAEKAKKKDQQNFDKWVKETKKARDKSSDEMKEFYDSVLELAQAEGGAS